MVSRRSWLAREHDDRSVPHAAAWFATLAALSDGPGELLVLGALTPRHRVLAALAGFRVRALDDHDGAAVFEAVGEHTVALVVPAALGEAVEELASVGAPVIVDGPLTVSITTDGERAPIIVLENDEARVVGDDQASLALAESIAAVTRLLRGVSGSSPSTR